MADKDSHVFFCILPILRVFRQAKTKNDEKSIDWIAGHFIHHPQRLRNNFAHFPTNDRNEG